MSQETIRDGPVCDAGQVRDTRWTDTRLGQLRYAVGRLTYNSHGTSTRRTRWQRTVGQKRTLDWPGVDTRRARSRHPTARIVRGAGYTG